MGAEAASTDVGQCVMPHHAEYPPYEVPICGMTDLVVDYHTTRPDLRPYSEEMMGGWYGRRHRDRGRDDTSFATERG